MILEHAVLDVIPGQEAEYEAAFAEAVHHIAGSPGFRSLRFYDPFPAVDHYEGRVAVTSQQA